MGTKLLAPAEGWWPSATKWGPFGPPGGPLGPLDKNKYNNSANTNTNTYIAQIEIQLWSKNKYNNRGQNRYVVVVVVVRNITIRVRYGLLFLLGGIFLYFPQPLLGGLNCYISCPPVKGGMK